MKHLNIRNRLKRVCLLFGIAWSICACGQGVAPEPVVVGAATERTETDLESVGDQESSEAAIDFDLSQHSLALELVTDALERPLFVTAPGDGTDRLFVLEQPGRIRIIQNGVLLETPFLEFEAQVDDGGNEQGLLGLAFAPDYASSGHFFLNYTNNDGGTTISRWTVSATDADLADAASEFVVLELEQPARNHNGGMVLFGPDGYLYVGTGDGGGANDRYENGQNAETLLGKMLRLDVTSDLEQPYTIPTDNPWVETDWTRSDGSVVDVRDEIWAVGLRNPWRYSFDQATGDLWIGDVGQNKVEEIHFTPAASLTGQPLPPLNFGWPIAEGSACFAEPDACSQEGLIQPVAEYLHDGHCSVTGGYVYRGEAHPVLKGVYLFGDFCSGTVWATVPDGAGGWSTVEAAKFDAQISSFGEDADGELYITDLGGTLYRISVQGSNE